MNAIANYRRQQGISILSLIFLLAILGTLTIAGFRIAPLYMNYFTVLQVVNDMYNDGSVLNKSKREIRTNLNKRFRTNNLWDFKAEEVVKIKKDPQQGTLLHISYEDRSPLIYNLEVIATFDKIVGGGH